MRQFIAIFLLAATLVGCGSKAPTTQPSSVADRQSQAINDPMNYKIGSAPPRDKTEWWQFDKEGFKRDWDHVFNP